jgi:hypothetical protein
MNWRVTSTQRGYTADDSHTANLPNVRVSALHTNRPILGSIDTISTAQHRQTVTHDDGEPTLEVAQALTRVAAQFDK